jgi:hypothetical protein
MVKRKVVVYNSGIKCPLDLNNVEINFQKRKSRSTALTPDFLVVDHHMAMSQCVIGFFELYIMVPAVNECW